MKLCWTILWEVDKRMSSCTFVCTSPWQPLSASSTVSWSEQEEKNQHKRREIADSKRLHRMKSRDADFRPKMFKKKKSMNSLGSSIERIINWQEIIRNLNRRLEVSGCWWGGASVSSFLNSNKYSSTGRGSEGRKTESYATSQYRCTWGTGAQRN